MNFDIVDMQKLTKIIVGIPSGGTIRVETVKSLLFVLSNTPNIIYDLSTPMSCYIHCNREQVVKDALSMNSDYIFFVDWDMKFPQDTLQKLLNLNVDIASVTYNYRIFPKKSVVKLDDLYSNEYIVDENVQKPIPLNAIKNPFRCAAAGTGLMLIKTDVFRKIPRPWFFFEPELDDVMPTGEDIWFCNKARTYGFDVWIDPSIEVGHIGNVVF